jgi:hypothetical protein
MAGGYLSCRYLLLDTRDGEVRDVECEVGTSDDGAPAAIARDLETDARLHPQRVNVAPVMRHAAENLSKQTYLEGAVARACPRSRNAPHI